MKRLLLLSTAAVIALAAPGIANAGIENLSISGNLDGHAYTGELSLDVSGGLALSGTGTLSILGLHKAPLVLITSTTPGNEGVGGSIGFRVNDGTDYFGHNATPTKAKLLDDLSRAQDAAMRVLIRRSLEHYPADEFIPVLGYELSKHADDFARRSGNYDRASKLNIIADHLMQLDDVIDNYDGAPL